MNIDLLVNRPEHIEDVAKMVYKEFVVPTNNKKTYEEVVEFFKGHTQRNSQSHL